MPTQQKKRRRKGKYTARTADRYVLYTEAVQCPEAELQFMRRVFRKRHGRDPETICEDFCGTAAISCTWVRQKAKNKAIGVDLDPEPLAWCAEHYLPKLTDDQLKRLTFRKQNVLDPLRRRVDAVLALNFSFGVFKQRSEMLKYMKRCRKALVPGGAFILDIYGGPESLRPQLDETPKDGFTYVWDQNKFNPITHECLNHIHFYFPDGTKMRKAFSYDWRLWSIAELQDLMRDAGLTDVTVYWEGTAEDGSGNGVFTPRTNAPVDDAFVAYVVGWAPESKRGKKTPRKR